MRESLNFMLIANPMKIQKTDDIRNLIQFEYERLRFKKNFTGVSFTKSVDNLLCWCWVTCLIESGRGKDFMECETLWDPEKQGFSVNVVTSAHSYYQFLTQSDRNDDSLDVALNRLSYYKSKIQLSSKTLESISACKNNQSLFTFESNKPVLVEDLEFQTLLLLANIFRQKGTDEYLIPIMVSRKVFDSRELYKNNHHTNPDSSTLNRLNRFYMRGGGEC